MTDLGDAVPPSRRVFVKGLVAAMGGTFVAPLLVSAAEAAGRPTTPAPTTPAPTTPAPTTPAPTTPAPTTPAPTTPPPTTPPPATPAPTAAVAPDQLANTGRDDGLSSTVGVGLLGAGAAALALARQQLNTKPRQDSEPSSRS